MTDIEEYNPHDTEDQLPIAEARDDQDFCWKLDHTAVQHLRDKIVAGEGAFPVTLGDKGGFFGQIFSDDKRLVELSRWVNERNGKVNLYEHINPVRLEYEHSPLGEKGKKAELVDIDRVVRFHVDLDPRKGKDLEDERKLILALLTDEERLRKLGLPGGPTTILDSGGGYWAFWDLIEPVKLPTLAEARKSGDEGRVLGEAARDAGRYNEWIARRLNSELDGKVADACFNIDRITRLVGTVNLPDAAKIAKGRKPAVAKIAGYWPDRAYRAEQFKKTDSDITNFSTKKERSAVQIGAIASIPAGEDAHDYIRTLGEKYDLGEETIRKILLGDGYSDEDRDKSHSGVLFNVMRACFWKDVPHEVILGLLLDKRLACSAEAHDIKKHKLAPEAFVRGQIRKNWPKFEKDRAKKLAEEMAADRAFGGNAKMNTVTVEAEPKASKQTANTDGSKIIIYASKPVVTARLFIKKHYPTLLYHNFDWLIHSGAIYKKLEDGRIETDLATFLATTWWYVDVKGQKEKELVRCDPTPKLISDVISMMKKDREVFRDIDAIEAPCWLKDAPDNTPPKHILACQNGLYDLEKGVLMPHTPDFFTRNALEFNYDESPNWPQRFMQLLYEIWPEAYAQLEEAKLHSEARPGRMKDINNEITLLQEIMGYLLVPDTTQQKIFLFIGVPGGGKGTLTRIIGHLIGKSNFCAPSLEGLCDTFGLEPLIGKQLAMVTDFQMGKKTDPAAITRELLRISGEDNMTIRRMRQKHWEGRLPTRFLLLMNEMIELPNIGGLSRRFVPLFFQNSFSHNPDPKLEGKLIAELPGILQWAIVGWRRLNARGSFSIPEATAEGIQDFKQNSSPELAFLVEDCDFSPAQKDYQMGKDDLYAAYTRYCVARNHRPKPFPGFFKAVYAVSERKITEYRPRKSDDGAERHRMIKGVKITKLRASKDDMLGISDPLATLVLSGPGAVADDLLGLIRGLKGDGYEQVVSALLGRIRSLRAA